MMATTLTITSQAVQDALAYYQTDPSDPDRLQPLRQVRQTLATILTQPAAQDPNGIADDLRQAHKLLVFGPLGDEPLDPQEDRFARRLGQQCPPWREPGAGGWLLALMLYYRAHEMPRRPDFDDLATWPPWLMAHYVAYAIRGVEVFVAPGEAGRFAAFYSEFLQGLASRLADGQPSASWQPLLLFVAQNINMIATYFAPGDLKEAMAARSRIICAALRSMGCVLEHDFPPRPPQRRIRVGVMLNHVSPHTETYATLPLLAGLDRQRFEVVMYALQRLDSPAQRQAESLAERFVLLPSALVDAAAALRRDDLDILFFGTNLCAVGHLGVFIAQHRLARAQVAFFTCPTTTGFATMDYFLLCRGDRDEQAVRDAHTERVLLLDEPGMCFDFASRPPSSGALVTRQALGIADDAVVFVSGANFFKIIPELRRAWIEVLAMVPGSVLLLYPFGPSWSASYAAQPFLRDIYTQLVRRGLAMSQLVVLPPVPSPADVAQILKVADVYLDSFPYSGAVSANDALEVGLPMVTMKGIPQRFGQASQLLRSLDLAEMIADDERAYLKLAADLGRDADRRRELRQRIAIGLRNNPLVFDSRWYGRQITRVFEEIVRAL